MKKRKIFPLLISMVMIFLCVSCNKPPRDAIEIKGIVIEVKDDSICICPDKESQEKINSAYVEVKLIKDETFKLGDIVKVSYDEAITEENPTQLIHVYSIEKLESSSTFTKTPYEIKLLRRSGATDALMASLQASGYSWSYAKDMNIVVDALSPLDSKVLDMPTIEVEKGERYTIEADVFPTSININRYSKDDVGKLEKGPIETIILKEKDTSLQPFTLEPNSIYVISMYWPEELQCHGTAMYYFVTH